MKRVLIITYYWPPAGGSGVQRWLKFSKYLKNYGWEPVIFTPKNPEYPLVDESLKKDIPEDIEVIRTKIWEPFELYRKLTGSRKSVNVGFAGTKKKSLLNSLAIWIRGNVFIPDSRKYWIKPSILFLSNLLDKEHFDAVVSTGPPHSMHLIASGLKRSVDVPWLADFRDPWTTIDYIDDLRLSNRSKRKHRALEKMVLGESDITVAVSEGMKEELKSLGANKVVTITNGFDPSDFEGIVSIPTGKFVIAHVGVMPVSRNPENLWHVLGKLCVELPELSDRLSIQLVGEVDESILADISKAGLNRNLDLVGHTDHKTAISYMRQASLLLLVINRSVNAKSILTGKVFEYMGAKRPILAVGPTDGDIAGVLDSTGAGTVVDYDNQHQLEVFLRTSFARFNDGDLHVNSEKVDQYSRPELAKRLGKTLDDISR